MTGKRPPHDPNCAKYRGLGNDTPTPCDCGLHDLEQQVGQLPRLLALLAIYRKDHFLCADLACECCNAHDEYDAETRRLRADALRGVLE